MRTTRTHALAGFIVDPNNVDRDNGHQIDWANVKETYRETPGLAPVLVTAAATAQNAVSLALGVALPGPIPSGTALDFGTDEFAITTADVAAGVMAIPVRALANALEGGETATYAGRAGSGNKVLKAGTAVGTLLGGGKLSPRVAATNPAVGLLATDAVENDPVAALSGYGLITGATVYENLLPDAVAGAIVAGIKTELNTAGASRGFLFKTFTDNRA
jgi:hypothetical protein